MRYSQACPRVYPRITRIRTRKIRIPTDHSLWVTHRRSPKLARGHSRSRGKADFTFNSESRHWAQWARGPCCPFISIQGHMCTAACTATDWCPTLFSLELLIGLWLASWLGRWSLLMRARVFGTLFALVRGCWCTRSGWIARGLLFPWWHGGWHEDSWASRASMLAFALYSNTTAQRQWTQSQSSWWSWVWGPLFR